MELHLAALSVEFSHEGPEGKEDGAAAEWESRAVG